MSSSKPPATVESLVDKLQTARKDIERSKQREDDAVAAATAVAATTEDSQPIPAKRIKSSPPVSCVPATTGESAISPTKQETTTNGGIDEQDVNKRADPSEEKKDERRTGSALAREDIEAAADADAEPETKAEIAEMNDGDDEEEDDDFPMIVDCGPDADDQ